MSTTSGDAEQFRLPKDVRPTHYDLTIRTDLEKLTFDGFVTIDLDVKNETSKIEFHSSKLNLGNAALHADHLQTEQVDTSRIFDEKTERATLHFSQSLPAGSKAQLRVAFDGELTDAMMGYYRSTYKVDGKDKHYALTQFEPTAARRAFPCWDEPAIKATFAVTLISREDTVNLGNMNVISEKTYDASHEETTGAISGLSKWMSSLSIVPDAAKALVADQPSTSIDTASGKWKITKFATTPLVSTYLVAWANGPFEYLESSYKSPISGKTRPLRIYATSDNIKQAQYALDVKAMVLPLYEEMFKIEFPLPKLDTLIAADFDAGAMENWGLITGRTSVYCIDPERPSLRVKKLVATVQSHEVAHQWFGNITTMEWWDNLYLNEGFATLMGEVLIPNKIYPEWQVNTAFINDHLAAAFELDAKLSSHPIEVPCPDAEKANQIFDSLSYSKAASVLRMLMDYVGEEKFVNGVSNYLKKHLYANTVSQDLWDGISESAGHDVGEMMRTWVGKMGYPVITVTETADGIHVRQDRFLETGPAEPKDNETIWTVPLALLTVGADGKPTIDKSIVLKEREMAIPLDKSKPFKLNAGTTGVYHVLYKPERFAKILDEAARPDSAFGADDRIGITGDTAALAKAGLVPTSSILTLADKLRNETQVEVWKMTAGMASGIARVWYENDKVWDGLKALQRSLFVPVVERLGYEYPKDEDPNTTELRNLAIGTAAAARDPGVIKELRERFDHFKQTGDDSRIPPNIMAAIYKTAVVTGGREEFEFMKKTYETPKDPSQMRAAVAAMSAHPDPAYTREMLEYAMAKARTQDLIQFFGTIAHTRNRRVANQFLKDNYDAVLKRYDGNFSFTNIVRYAFETLTTEKDHEETVAFFKDKDTSRFALALQQSLDSIATNAAWVKRSTSDVEGWLDKWQA